MDISIIYAIRDAILKTAGSYLGSEANNPAISAAVSGTVTFKSSQHSAPDKADQKISNDLTVNFYKAAGGK